MIRDFEQPDWSSLLPPRHIVSVGGGIASTLLLPELLIKKYGRENVTLVMAAIKEDEASAREFVEAVERYLGVRVKRITIGGKEVKGDQWAEFSIWDIFFKVRFLGNSRNDPCSQNLKRQVMTDYVTQNHPAWNTVLHVGIGAHEIDRMMAIRRKWGVQGYEVRATLAEEMPDLDRDTQIALCKEKIGWVPLAYELGFSHNNCNLFCVKAGHREMARLLYYKPEVYKFHEEMELKHQQEIGHTSTIMRDRKMVDGVTTTTPLTMRDFRLRMEAEWNGQLFPPFFEDLESTPACTFCDSVA